MDLENGSPLYSSSCQLSPHTPPDNDPNLSEPLLLPQAQPASSQKRKAGRKRFQETRHPTYWGVRHRNGKWVCEVREPKTTSRVWLGTYPTPEMAARAHDVGALALRGTSAMLNFPNSASFLPIVKSSSPEDIRAAAVEAAEAFRPSSSTIPKNKYTRKTKRSSKKVTKTKISLMDAKIQEMVLESFSLNNMHNIVQRGIDGGDVIKSSTAEENNNNNNSNDDPSAAMFLDEEALFNMPGLLDRMAEGLCLFPLSMERASDHWDDLACIMDLNLWTD